MHSLGAVLVAAVSVAALASCDDDGVPVTPQALAYVAAEYTGTPDTATNDLVGWFDAFEDGAVAVDLRYDQSEDGFGDSVTVTVGTLATPELLDCDATVGLYTLGCAETPDGTLRWNLDDPEEDPGGVFVLVPRSEDQTVLVTYSGPRITADPRTLDLPVTVETVFEIANDDRIDATTSQEFVDRSADLPYWSDTLEKPGG